MNALLPPSELKPHRLTAEEVLAFARSGAFDGRPKMELLDGTLYEMSPQTAPHFLAKNRITFRIQTCIAEKSLPFEALSEPTILVADGTTPEPDIVICENFKGDGFIPADNIRLAIEISVTSLAVDHGYKRPLYATAAIPEYWIVDIKAGTILQFWDPVDDNYRQERQFNLGSTIAAQTVPEVVLETSHLG